MDSRWRGGMKYSDDDADRSKACAYPTLATTTIPLFYHNIIDSSKRESHTTDLPKNKRDLLNFETLSRACTKASVGGTIILWYNTTQQYPLSGTIILFWYHIVLTKPVGNKKRKRRFAWHHMHCIPHTTKMTVTDRAVVIIDIAPLFYQHFINRNS